MRTRPRWSAVREVVLFLVGIGIVLYEVMLPEPRWLIIAIAGGMVGLPGFLFTSTRLNTSTGSTPVIPPAPAPPAPPQAPTAPDRGDR